MEPILRNAHENSWIFIILISTLLLTTAARLLFSKQYNTLGSLTHFVEQQESITVLSVFTNIIFSVLAGLLLYPFVQLPFLDSAWSSFLNAAMIIGLVLLYFTLRYLFNLILIFTMGLDEEMSNIIKVKTYFRTFAIFLLILLNFLLYYSEINNFILFLIGIAVIALMLILEYIFQFSNKANRRIYYSYYFILYLCILEILPVLYVVMHWNS